MSSDSEALLRACGVWVVMVCSCACSPPPVEEPPPPPDLLAGNVEVETGPWVGTFQGPADGSRGFAWYTPATGFKCVSSEIGPCARTRCLMNSAEIAPPPRAGLVTATSARSLELIPAREGPDGGTLVSISGIGQPLWTPGDEVSVAAVDAADDAGVPGWSTSLRGPEAITVTAPVLVNGAEISRSEPLVVRWVARSTKVGVKFGTWTCLVDGATGAFEVPPEVLREYATAVLQVDGEEQVLVDAGRWKVRVALQSRGRFSNGDLARVELVLRP